MVSRRSTGLAIACAFAAYSAFTVILTFPLVLHLASTMPHDLGDPLLSTSILWWNAHVLPLTRRWWDGFAFFPAPGMLGFSDHRLGLSLIASPLQWLGAGAVTAHNLTFLATFPLSAIAAYLLAFALTRKHDAAALCGLAYGFNPFRILHSAHLELLAGYGMPLALAALHVHRETGRPAWLVGFTLALILQGLCSTYYLLFFSVLLAMWVVWFASWRDWRPILSILACCGVGAIALSPIAAGYARIHEAYGFARSFGEIQLYSADLSSFVTASPLLSLWGWTSSLNEGERQLFPGLTITILALSGVVAGVRRARGNRHDTGGLRALSSFLLIVSIALSAVALGIRVSGPGRIQLGRFTLSLGVFFKPLSLAIAAYLAAVALDPRMRAAYRRSSPFAFYIVAAFVLFVCSLGPKPTFLGEQFLYEPPYLWLMRTLPVFRDGVRAPARFAMPAVLALSVAASLAFDRLTRRRVRWAVGIIAAAGIIADGWIGRLPLPAIPDVWPAARAEGFAAVAELPIAEIWRDAIAMYRATVHDHPVVNGMSGHDPRHYTVLRLALADHDATALDALTSRGPLLLVADKRDAGDWPAFARVNLEATPVGEDDRWMFFRLAPRAPVTDTCGGEPLPVARAWDDRGAVDVSRLTDGNPFTAWITPHPQHAGDTLVLDLGRVARPCAVVLCLGTGVELYPRALTAETSLDGASWTAGFTGKTGGLTVRAALEQPRDVRVPIPFPIRSARFLRLRLEESDKLYPWLVTDVLVRGAGQ